jgi:hypothetical protein
MAKDIGIEIVASSTNTLKPNQVCVKRRFSPFKLILFNAIVCGLEFCASAGFTYIPPLLLKGESPLEFDWDESI